MFATTVVLISPSRWTSVSDCEVIPSLALFYLTRVIASVICHTHWASWISSAFDIESLTSSSSIAAFTAVLFVRSPNSVVLFTKVLLLQVVLQRNPPSENGPSALLLMGAVGMMFLKSFIASCP
jgi:hypothetical protein